jgi:hypothetical protein
MAHIGTNVRYIIEVKPLNHGKWLQRSDLGSREFAVRSYEELLASDDSFKARFYEQHFRGDYQHGTMTPDDRDTTSVVFIREDIVHAREAPQENPKDSAPSVP